MIKANYRNNSQHFIISYSTPPIFVDERPSPNPEQTQEEHSLLALRRTPSEPFDEYSLASTSKTNLQHEINLLVPSITQDPRSPRNSLLLKTGAAGSSVVVGRVALHVADLAEQLLVGLVGLGMLVEEVILKQCTWH